MSQNSLVEYMWLDGETTQQLRSKTRVLPYSESLSVGDCPEWGFDGSSTKQAAGNSSDCLLKPAYLCPDPFRGEGNYLLLCEVYTAEDTPHFTNTRVAAREFFEENLNLKPFIGFEQEYTIIQNGKPYGWPQIGEPRAQGPFYCGAGFGQVHGRDLVEEHLSMCQEANLSIYGVNAEVMLGQWEFQIGYRGIPNEKADPLTISDQLWIARYILYRVSEFYDVQISFDNKPMKGDWNGSGLHTNFSTAQTRDKSTGAKFIGKIISYLAKHHQSYIVQYGEKLEERLTGLHETCDINTFKYGHSDRGASVRVPIATTQNGYGYFEDRRPGANADPYTVSILLVKAAVESPNAF